MVKDRKKEMADQTFQKWQLKDTVADTHLEGTGVPLSFPGGVLTSSGSEAPLRALECPQSTQLTLTQRNTLVRTLLCSIQIPLMLTECAILQEPV